MNSLLNERKRRTKIVLSMLDELFPLPHDVPLRHEDVYTLLIAVLLSARCTDARVNRVTPHLFAMAKTPETMACLSYEKVLDVVRPCGLGPAKARAILGLSKILEEKYGGEVPDSAEALESLPGVGHKTASVVLVQGFGIPAFPVDTHIYRLAHRFKLSTGKSVGKVERDLKERIPKEQWGKVHLQFIQYGRTICPSRGCDGQRCVICRALCK